MKAFHPRFGIAKACGIDRHFFFDDYFHLRFEELPREQLQSALAHVRGARRAHRRGGVHCGQMLALHEFAGELLIFAEQSQGVFCYTSALRRRTAPRSEEHTSELQSLMRISYAVFCLKKKKKTKTPIS